MNFHRYKPGRMNRPSTIFTLSRTWRARGVTPRTCTLASVPVARMGMAAMTTTINASLDEETLREIASTTRGRYFRATSAEALEQIYEEIDKLERSEITTVQYTRWREGFLPFLLTGLGLLVLHRLMSDTRFRSLP